MFSQQIEYASILARRITTAATLFVAINLAGSGVSNAQSASSVLTVSCSSGSVDVEIQQNPTLSKLDVSQFLKDVDNRSADGANVYAIARVTDDFGENLPSRPGTLTVAKGALWFSASAVGESDFKVVVNPYSAVENSLLAVGVLVDSRLGQQTLDLSCTIEARPPRVLQPATVATQKTVTSPPSLSSSAPSRTSSFVALSQIKSNFARLLPTAFTADSEALLTFDKASLMAIDPITGERLFKHFVDEFDRIAVAPDGKRVALSSTDDGMRLFSLKSGKTLWRNDTEIDYSFSVSTPFVFGPLGKRIFLRADSDDFMDVGRLTVVEAASGRVSQLETEVYRAFGVVFSDDGQFAFVAGQGEIPPVSGPVIEKYDLVSNRTVAKARIIEGTLSKPDPSSDWFVVYNENQLKVMDHYLSELRSFTFPEDFERGDRDPVHVFVSQDANYAFLIASNGNYLFVDLVSGQIILTGRDRVLRNKTALARFPFASLSHDGSLLALTNWGYGESTLRFFEIPQDWSKLDAFPDLNDRKAALLENLAEGNLTLFREGLGPEMIFGSPFAQPLLHHVAETGSQEAVLAVIEVGADIDEVNSRTGKSAIMVAVEAGNAETATMLLNLGASSAPVAERGKTFVSTLLSADTEAFSGTPLAALQSQLAGQFSPEKIDDLLVAAAGSGNQNIIGTLLSLGANPDHLGVDGLTALMVAAASKAPSAFDRVQALLRWGNADPNIATSEGATALALAIASEADEKIIRTLIAVSDLERGENGSYVWDVAKSLENSRILAVLPAQGWKPPNIPMPNVAQFELSLSGNMSKNDVMSVQQELKDQGLYSSSIDGLWGPASRRGLASYFKVIFDDHRSVMKEFCALVGEDVAKRRSASDDYLGKASFNGLEWVYEGFFVLGVDATLRNPSTGFSVTCELRISDPNVPVAEASFDLWLARISTREYDVTLDFIGEGRCDDKQWIKSSLYMSGDPIAFDFACLKTMAGIPVNSSGTATTWRKY